ncbi:MAG: hypothetical protein Q4G02_00575 [bacterium]|nr:hypothetical protein [bacterium]
MKKQTTQIIILSVIALIIGLGGSYFFKQKSGTDAEGGANFAGGSAIATVAEEGKVKNGDIFGSNNADEFKDSAQGYLTAGGIGDEEGSHSLLRAGGASQTVYLTSSVTDLDKFVGMEIKVWGETFSGQKAGWLMDVGRVEVINVEGAAPEE